jgi:NADH-quinone oxidoreductase subunit J
MVITVQNPVHSVLFLILSFIASSALLFFLEVEFIPFIFIVVYVGAIAVLFLFVVMMLDIKITTVNKDLLKYFPIGSLIGLFFLIEILHTLYKDIPALPSNFLDSYKLINWINNIDGITNMESLGQILYTGFFTYFLIVGLILLVAMFGAISLTLTFNKKAKIQSIYRQISRNFNNAIFLSKN